MFGVCIMYRARLGNCVARRLHGLASWSTRQLMSATLASPPELPICGRLFDAISALLPCYQLLLLLTPHHKSHPYRPFTMARHPLPTFYYLFFGLFEPSLTLIGAYLAIFTPGQYASDLLPAGVERVTAVLGDTIRGQMIIGGLGSCELALTEHASSG